ncbi:hypothetical protein KUS54_RS20935 [Escherichia coli]|uniref:hypothetical protein n=1 Tax=Escherichia coli TaxID=562 RepID=UPI00211D2245|nr:hypothetical protein [Escherichia coli]EHR8714533.1 hypothetical protein [Escherichia coli]UUN41360.1 hypothetical protein A7A19_14680 [Escherichia coli]
MTKMTSEKIESLYSEKVNFYYSFLYITVSLSKLEEVVEDASRMVDIFRNFRLQAVERYEKFRKEGLEYQADCFLYSQCVLSSLHAMINVLINIKKQENSKAWDSLIDAYEYLDIAHAFLKKHPHNIPVALKGLGEITEVCNLWEKAFFPQLSYTSAGFTETIGKCSVCFSNFACCEHVEGYIYHGVFCQRIDRRILEANHLALVKNPKDRRCIIETTHDKDGYQIDVFSREKIEGETEPKPQEFKVKIMRSRGLSL